MTTTYPVRTASRTVGPPAAARSLPRTHPNAVLAAIAAGTVAVLGLWWHDTTAVSGFGDWLTNAGRITGLLAGYAVVVLVVLMARLPPVERGVGADRLARWHAMGGRYSVSLIVAHALLITWGYAVTAHTNVISQTGTFWTSYPDVLMASVAGLLFVMIGITSARAARRRMRYETWYYLHLYTYLAIALAFSHQFADGADFMTHPLARWIWAAMYVAAAAAILWYRVVTPVRQALRHQLRVESVVVETRETVSIVVSGRHLDELRAEAGQFFRWRFLCKGMWWASTPYSLSALPRPDRMRITAKALGDHSSQLRRMRPGTRVVAEGPYGAMTAALRRRRKVLLIAGGVGITPLRTLFEQIPALPGELTLIYRARRREDLVFRHELDDLAARRGAVVHYLTGRRADLGGDPLSREALQLNVPDLASHDVYVCGPEPMTSSVVASLRSAGVRRRHIHCESFAF